MTARSYQSFSHYFAAATSNISPSENSLSRFFCSSSTINSAETHTAFFSTHSSANTTYNKDNKHILKIEKPQTLVPPTHPRQHLIYCKYHPEHNSKNLTKHQHIFCYFCYTPNISHSLKPFSYKINLDKYNNHKQKKQSYQNILSHKQGNKNKNKIKKHHYSMTNCRILFPLYNQQTIIKPTIKKKK